MSPWCHSYTVLAVDFLHCFIFFDIKFYLISIIIVHTMEPIRRSFQIPPESSDIWGPNQIFVDIIMETLSICFYISESNSIKGQVITPTYLYHLYNCETEMKRGKLQKINYLHALSNSQKCLITCKRTLNLATSGVWV